MLSLNYHHLYYFWIVAREGGISHASNVLDVSPSTISAQISQLENTHGVKLFDRVGRNLRLSEVGHIAFRYAEEIFVLGREMTHAIHGWSTRGPRLLQVGVADAVPKLAASRLLQPALDQNPELRLICREDVPDRLLAELAVHRLDMVLLDSPIDPALPIKAVDHLLAHWRIAFFGTAELVSPRIDDFPLSLEEAPVLLPTAESAMRRSLDRWFESNGVAPRIVGEFEDSALMKSFSESGAGLFPAPAGLKSAIERQHSVETLGVLKDSGISYYAVTVERRLEHPGVEAICRAGAREAEATFA
jgi:LysR family transcriptional activator of nhaA